MADEETYDPHVIDLNGDPVRPGDRIAGAFRAGDVAQLRTGTVLGFGQRSGKTTIKVQWEISSGYGGGSKAVNTLGQIEAGLKRFVRIEG